MKPTIALFIADPKCSVQCANGMIASLGSDYNFKIFSKNALENNFFEKVKQNKQNKINFIYPVRSILRMTTKTRVSNGAYAAGPEC